VGWLVRKQGLGLQLVLALKPVLALELVLAMELVLALGPEAPLTLLVVAPQASLVQGLVVELDPEGSLSQPWVSMLALLGWHLLLQVLASQLAKHQYQFWGSKQALLGYLLRLPPAQVQREVEG